MLKSQKSFLKTFVVVFVGLFLASCGVQQNYAWNGYSGHLLSYYKNPDETQKFADKMNVSIQKAEAKNMVPPGMYAEYGYLLLKMNDDEAAAVYFLKEKEKWPESAFLMDKVILKLSGSKPSEEDSSNSQPLN